MPASSPASCRSRRRRPPRGLRRDDAGVSEVVGSLLAFAVVTGVFILSMTAFKAAQQSTQDRVLKVQAESAAARVASSLVQAGVLAESEGTSVRVRFLVELPSDFDGVQYRVALVVPGGADSATVQVSVPSRNITATAPLFAVESPTGVTLCATSVAGGHIYARYSDTSPGTPATPCMFLEAAA